MATGDGLIRECQNAGYRVKLIFLQLASADEAIMRVAQRVKQGNGTLMLARCDMLAEQVYVD